METGVQAAVGIEPGDAAAWHAIVGREIPRQNYLPVARYRDREDKRVFVIGRYYLSFATGSRVKARVQAAVWVQPRDAIARSSLDGGEETANHDLAIGLQGHEPNPVARAGDKAIVQRAIRVQPGDISARLTVE